MKNKFLLVFSSVIILSSSSLAQVQLSLWGGVNNSSFGGNPPEDAGSREIQGLAAGANLDFQPSQDFVISVEPSFEQRGSTIDINLEEGIKDTTLKFKIKLLWTGTYV